jgi:hypothetical protein
MYRRIGHRAYSEIILSRVHTKWSKQIVLPDF